MERLQEKFILQELNSYPVCEIRDKYTDKLKEVSTPAVRNILNQKFVSGSDMKVVLCLFDTLFLSVTNNPQREKGLYNLSRHIQKWVTKMELLPVKSVEGFIYITDFFSEDIQVVIKVPQQDSGFESMVREYFIGLKSLNKLRYLIPTFVYTLGAFLCPKPTKSGKICSGRSKKTAFVLYEKIPGDSVDGLLKNREIDFDQWLLVFIQMLLGLEVAQREVRFTHFDLHTGNVMVRRKDNFSYTVPLDTTSYHVNNPVLIPNIIDFGLASSYIDDRYIGSFDHARYGMLNFMVPGYDMYKFMIYSIAYAKDKVLKKQIMQLFSFYGGDDPYNIVKDGAKGVEKATSNYCKEASFSQVANYTPLMFVEWLWKEYRKKLQPHITVSDRLQYLPIRYSSTIKEYDDIFQHSSDGRDKAIALTDECIHIKPSYVMTKYNIKVLENYNKGLQSPDLASRIKGLNMYLKDSENLLEVDMAMLEKVFDIKIPDQEALTSIVNNLLELTIRNSNPKKKRQAVLDLNIFVYQEKLNPYLQFYFTILELNLEDKFDYWISRFKASDIYRFYTRNVTENERAIRWGQTLLASIFS
jgi:hypothetical protein